VCHSAFAQPAGGYSPEEAVRRMVLPEGFHAEVVAAEPLVRQPVTATFDDRGRLWVIEYLQYPNPAGLKPVSVDQYLRTEYDRLPEPPPRGPRGADRVKILEDTDGDGRYDRATVFVDGLNLASALAVGHGGVFVGQAPYLLFYPDRDRDDRPDGDPEVLLSGFGLQDAHATLNSLTWGPDGWLYGAQGSTVTARIQGIEFQQGIWRYHPRTRRFELFAEGGGNTWGLDFDAAGNAFGSSNGGYIAFHMVQGGYYVKGFAKHGPLHNPHAYGYFGPIPYEGPKLGGHVTPGGIVYLGDAYPPSFQGAFIAGNLLSNAVYWHPLTPLGSTFQGRHGGTLVDARDSWFRPIDLLLGPDAAVYVVDWYDRRASHLDPRDNWDRSNGRIYRIVFGQRRQVPAFDLSRLSSDELVDLRTSSNEWFAREARRLLGERRDSAVVPRLRELLREERDPVRALRDLWALHACGGLDEPISLESLDHPIGGVRSWTIRLLGDDRKLTRPLRARLRRLAEEESDPAVRAQLASSCQRWDSADALSILEPLLRRDEDRDDPHIPLLLWWAVERQLREDRRGVIALLGQRELQARPLVSDFLLERTARALAADSSAGDFEACAWLLATTSGREATTRLMAGIEQGLAGRRLLAVPPPLEPPLAEIWEAAGPEPPAAVIRFAARLGSAGAVAAAHRRVEDTSIPESERIALVELLGQLGRSESRPVLLRLLGDPSWPGLQLAAASALAGYSDPRLGDELMKVLSQASSTVRRRILQVVCGRPPWAARLVEALERGELDSREISLAQVQQVGRLGDPALLARLEAVWGKVPRTGSPEKLRRIAEVRGLLPEGDKGDAARGRPLFQEQCAGCHQLFGEGEAVGPDLTGAERNDLDFLLTSLIDPSAAIRKEYQAQTVALSDGRVLVGLIVAEDDQTLTLFSSDQTRTTVPRAEVEEIRPSEVSVMPEGLLDSLTESQIRDLFRYLQSGGPP
jgi:putative membrane-bound dehydrogenase-like protein